MRVTTSTSLSWCPVMCGSNAGHADFIGKMRVRKTQSKANRRGTCCWNVALWKFKIIPVTVPRVIMDAMVRSSKPEQDIAATMAYPSWPRLQIQER